MFYSSRGWKSTARALAGMLLKPGGAGRGLGGRDARIPPCFSGCWYCWPSLADAGSGVSLLPLHSSPLLVHLSGSTMWCVQGDHVLSAYCAFLLVQNLPASPSAAMGLGPSLGHFAPEQCLGALSCSFSEGWKREGRSFALSDEALVVINLDFGAQISCFLEKAHRQSSVR